MSSEFAANGGIHGSLTDTSSASVSAQRRRCGTACRHSVTSPSPTPSPTSSSRYKTRSRRRHRRRRR
uniref:Uncharacterized protein n=1 Tax=Oryza rufipogon TaxID=4529 RepID=A0A0E0NJK9_ORYRU